MKTRLSLSNSLSLAWNSEDSGHTLGDASGPFKLPSCATSHSTFLPPITTILYAYFVWFQHHTTPFTAKILHQFIDSSFALVCPCMTPCGLLTVSQISQNMHMILCACWVRISAASTSTSTKVHSSALKPRVETWVSDRYRAQHVIHLAAPTGPCCCPGSQGIPS